MILFKLEPKLPFCHIFCQGKTDTPPVECSSRNSYMEPVALNADTDSITSEYNKDKLNFTIDLKVKVHRKNSSESSEEAAQLNKPIVTSINVHEAELVTKQEPEQQHKKKLGEISKHNSGALLKLY